jgi:hypothetical protein
MELLYRRIGSEFGRIPTGKKTAAAEEGLLLGSHTYFYVERPHPHFGEAVVAFSDGGATAVAAVAAPFDTGGMWARLIPTTTAMSDELARSLVSKWAFDVPGYTLPFSAWTSSEFESLADYRKGLRPGALLVEEIDLEGCSDQSWTWETRLPKGSGDESFVTAERVFVMEGRRDIYLRWLRDTSWLSVLERRSHLAWVGEHVTEVANPVRDMIEYLDSL